MNTTQLPQIAEFPVHLLGWDLQQVIEAIHYQTQAPIGLIASSVIGVMALSCQDLFDVSPKAGLRHPISLFQMVLAQSGDRKSTVDKLLMKPARELEKSLEATFQCDRQQYNLAMSVWKVECRALEKALQKAISGGCDSADEISALEECHRTKPVAPICKRLFINDATTAAVKKALGMGWPSLCLLSDEAGGVLQGELLREGSLLNSLWSGQSIVVDRASSDSFRVEDARLGCMLMVQPGLFEDYLKARGAQARQSGFLARYLLCSPPSTIGYRYSHHDRQAPALSMQNALDWFHQRVRDRLERAMACRENQQERVCLQLSDDASIRWHEEYNLIESLSASGQPLEAFRDYASKHMEQVSRIAAVFAGFYDSEAKEIPNNIMHAAIGVANWYLDHFMALMKASTVTEEELNADLLEKWLNEKETFWQNGWIPKNYILKYGPNKLRGRRELNGALDELANRGRIVFSMTGRTKYVRLIIIRLSTPSQFGR